MRVLVVLDLLCYGWGVVDKCLNRKILGLVFLCNFLFGSFLLLLFVERIGRDSDGCIRQFSAVLSMPR